MNPQPFRIGDPPARPAPTSRRRYHAGDEDLARLMFLLSLPGPQAWLAGLSPAQRERYELQRTPGKRWLLEPHELGVNADRIIAAAQAEVLGPAALRPAECEPASPATAAGPVEGT